MASIRFCWEGNGKEKEKSAGCVISCAASCAASAAAVSACGVALFRSRVSLLFGTVFPYKKGLSVSAGWKLPQTLHPYWALFQVTIVVPFSLFRIHLESVSSPGSARREIVLSNARCGLNGTPTEEEV